MDANAIRAKYDSLDAVRPETLATDLGVSGKVVRAFLRQTFTRPVEAKGTTWVLNGDQARATVEHFLARRSPVQPAKHVAPVGAGVIAERSREASK